MIHLIYSYMCSLVGVGDRLSMCDPQVVILISTGSEYFPFFGGFKLDLGINQPHIQRVQWVLSSGSKTARGRA